MKETIEEEKKTDEETCVCEECDCKEDNEECDCNKNCSCNLEDDELKKLKALIIDMDNKLKYSQAELINYRKRKDDEVSNMLKFANEDLILEIIPILDNFERALKLADDENESLNQFLEGFKLLYSHLDATLKNFGVEEISAQGEKFDPNLHEVLLTDKDITKEDEIVLEVLLKGYMLKGRMIRPAKVKINKLN